MIGREMMRELRCITFTEQEAIAAVVDRRHAQRHALPAGMIRGLSVNIDGNNTCALEMEDYHGNRPCVTIPEQEIAAALVAYCLSRKIPMPRKSSKTIHVIGGDLTLVLTISDFDLINAHKFHL